MLKEKDVLEYTKDELEELSVDELEELLKKCEDGQSLYHTRQMTKKILINSLYGAFTKDVFILFNSDIAAAITGNGRYFIKKTASNVESKLQSLSPSDKPYVIAGDTDSFYYQIKPIMSMIINKNPGKTIDDYVNLADKFENNVIQPTIQSTIEEFADDFNVCDRSAMVMKREAIADKCCFVAKKKYFARVRDSEGVRYPLDNPHMKVMGLEIARSNTPNWGREKLMESLNIILDKTETELKNWLSNIRIEFKSAKLSDICLFGGVSNINYKIGDKNIPWMNNAALYYNRYILNSGLTDKFSEIKSGDKVKLIYLNVPNIIGTDVIAFIDDKFLEHIKDLIDYDVCFEKGFLNPLENMIKVLGYDIRNNCADIEDW